MTNRDSFNDDSRDRQINQLVAQYYEAIENGEHPRPHDILRANPEFAHELKSFFNDLANVNSAMGGATDHRIGAETFRKANQLTPPVKVTRQSKQIGDYRLLEEIARGGMGIVYKAEQISLKRTVALKMVLGGHFASESQVNRFRREAMAAGGLQHANIVSVHDVGEFEGNAYYTMDYVDGDSLADRLREGPLSPQKAAELISKIARAIQSAHEQGILHRDLKPANILIDREGQPHITDFGLAKSLMDSSTSLNDLTATGQIIGTPSYMSPEQAGAKHAQVSVASDVYSLGAILYYCLSGRAPFVADSTIDTLRQVIENDPVSVRLLSPQVPRDLETICLKCLSKDPHRRYTAAGELADDLQRFLERRPIQARRAGLFYRGWKWCRRRPDIAALVTLLLLGLVVGLASVSFWWQMAEYAKLDAEEATIEAKQSLYASRMREAQAIRLARQPGYREEAWSRLREASQMTDIEIDPDAIREEAVACLGDFVGLKPITIQGPALAGTNDCVVFLDDDRIAFSQNDGSISIRSISRSNEAEFIAREGQAARAMVASSDGTHIFIVDNQTLQRWSRSSENRWAIDWGIPARYTSLYMNLSLAKDTLAVIQGKSIQLVDAKSGREVRKLIPPREYEFRFPQHGFLHVAISPDGKFVAAADTPTSVFVWNMDSDRPVQEISASSSGDVRLEFSADGRYLVVGSDEGITSYLTSDFTQWSICRTGAVRALRSSPAGDYILVQTRSGSVQLWNTVTQRNVATLPHPSSTLTIGTVDFSPSGEKFLSAGNRVIRVWRFNELPEKRVLVGHNQSVQRIAFHPHSTVIASGGLDGLIKFWDYRNGQLLHSVELSEPVLALAYSPNARLFAASTMRSLLIWNTDAINHSSGHTIDTSLHDVMDLCFSRDSQQLITTGVIGVQRWNVETPQDARDPLLIAKDRYPRLGKSIDVSANARHVAFASQVHQLQVLRLQDQAIQVVHSFPKGHFANCVVADPVLDCFYASTSSGTVQVIDVESGEIVGEFQDERHLGANTIAVSQNGELLATDRTPTTVGIYETKSRRRIFSLGDEGAAIHSIAWGAEDRRLAVGLADGHIMVWDLGRVVTSLRQEQLAGELNLFEDLPTQNFPREDVTMFEQNFDTIKQEPTSEDIADRIIVKWGLSPRLAIRSQLKPTQLPPSVIDQILQADGEVSTSGITAVTLAIDELAEICEKLAARGFQLESIRPYLDEETCRVAAAWRRLDVPTRFAVGLSQEELEQMHRAGDDQLIEIGAYLPTHTSTTESFFAIWRNKDSNLISQWWALAEPASQRNPTFHQLANTHRPELRYIYFDHEGNERYCELWNQIPPRAGQSWSAIVHDDFRQNQIAEIKAPVRSFNIAQTPDLSKTYLSFVSRFELDKSHTHYIIDESIATFKRVNLAMLATGHFPRCICVFRNQENKKRVAAIWEK